MLVSSALVVDGDAVVRMAVAEQLTILGVGVVYTAGTAEEARQQCRRHHDIDVAFVDLLLPRQQGADLLDDLQQPGGPRGIVLTSSYFAAWERPLPRGVLRRLEKPFGFEELEDCLALARASAVVPG